MAIQIHINCPPAPHQSDQGRVIHRETATTSGAARNLGKKQVEEDKLGAGRCAAPGRPAGDTPLSLSSSPSIHPFVALDRKKACVQYHHPYW